jgi:carbon-monoxide dehydrogenase medium subunit
VIPRPFAYERPATVEDAVAARAGGGTVLAGGQSLVPMMSLGLARPELVVDISRLELAGLEARNGSVVVGALTRHRELELGAEARDALPLLAAAAAHVGNPRVRNRGTLGGSLAHADPAAELPVACLVHGGTVVARGPGGDRRIALEDFFVGYLETALAPDEVLVSVELERLPEGTRIGFYEVAQRADDFALACAAAAVLPDGEVRVVVGGVADRPVRADAQVDPDDDAFVSGAFRGRLARVCASRALEAAA